MRDFFFQTGNAAIQQVFCLLFYSFQVSETRKSFFKFGFFLIMTNAKAITYCIDGAHFPSSVQQQNFYLFLYHIFCTRNKKESRTPNTLNNPPTMANNLVNK